MENVNVDMETSVIKYICHGHLVSCAKHTHLVQPCYIMWAITLVPPYILFAWTMDDILGLPFLHLTIIYLILVFWMPICLKTQLIRHTTIYLFTFCENLYLAMKQLVTKFLLDLKCLYFVKKLIFFTKMFTWILSIKISNLHWCMIVSINNKPNTNARTTPMIAKNWPYMPLYAPQWL